MSAWRKLGLACITLSVGSALAGCAAGPESVFATKPAGFWAGLWHGFICLLTFIVSLFTHHVKMYEVNNGGRLYDFGFLIGAGITFLSFSILLGRLVARGGREGLADLEGLIRRNVESWVRRSGYTGEESEEVTKRIEQKVRAELRRGEKNGQEGRGAPERRS